MPATSFSGRAAWVFETEFIRATVLQSGGHLAELVLQAGECVNPLWVQTRPTIDSEIYDPVIHGDFYGRNPESRLLSGLAGHNLCFPFWGNPSAAEFAAGMTFHGETNIRRWQLIEESRDGILIEVLLPESGMKVRRRFRSHGYALHCDSEAMNLTSWDQPFGWCEHVTVGPPFLESGAVRFDASLGDGFITGDGTGPRISWPHGAGRDPDSRSFDLTRFSESSHRNLVNSFVVKASHEWAFFTVFQRRFGLLFGYVFPRADFPWLNVWENNDEQLQARAMEFSNTPHHGTMKTLIRSAAIWGVPTYEWLDALSTVSKRFAAFLCPVPRDFCGTADIYVQPHGLEIVESGTRRLFQVPV
jgi:hypothetical protein